jgi:hypothetical protein
MIMLVSKLLKGIVKDEQNIGHLELKGKVVACVPWSGREEQIYSGIQSHHRRYIEVSGHHAPAALPSEKKRGTHCTGD